MIRGPDPRLKTLNSEGFPKMRNGWFVDKATHIVKEQEMHRQVLPSDSQLCQDTCNVDGTTHKGIYEILQERGDTCIAIDNKAMTKTCSKQRRRDLLFATDLACDSHVRCCLDNTLRWEPDFAAQKCKLQEACESMGVSFTMMMICHPECNPIEGNYYRLSFFQYHITILLTHVHRLLELYEALLPRSM